MLTAEQIVALELKARQLVEVALVELDTAQWPTLDSKDGRGDRVWLKKNAAETLRLVDQIRALLRTQPGAGDAPPPAEQDDTRSEAQRLIDEAEARARQMLGRPPSETPN